MKTIAFGTLFIALSGLIFIVSVHSKDSRVSRPISSEPSATQQISNSTTPPARTTVNAKPGQNFPLAAIAARDWFVKNMNASLSNVQIVSVSEQTWPDSCMGAAGPGDVCSPPPVSGYKILLRLNDDARYLYEIHTDMEGQNTGNLGAHLTQ